MDRNLLRAVIGKIWNLPNTLPGLAYGGLGHAIGTVGYWLGLKRIRPSCRIGHNAVQFIGNPLTLGRCAIAIGNTISYGGRLRPEHFGAYGDATVNIGRHEEAHTRQSEVLGILFLPCYLAAGGFSGPAGNPFEKVAQDYGRGGNNWRPWQSVSAAEKP